MSDLDAEKLKFGLNLSYDDLTELLYTSNKKLNEMKVNNSFLDIGEVKLILDAVTKINHYYRLNLSEELRIYNKDVLSKREKFISTNEPLLIKAIGQNSLSEGMSIIEGFITLTDTLKDDYVNFKEVLLTNLGVSQRHSINEDSLCDNCGSKNFVEIDGIATCQSCGTKYPNMPLKNIGIHEELKEKEIRRKEREIDGLLNPQFPGNVIHENGRTINGNEYSLTFWASRPIIEPRPGILDDDEILKYAPESKAAKKIRKKEKKGFFSR
ncbi:MAG: TFIIB-type zinc finger domain-containing protein [Methanobacteriaceae archaeon]